MSAIVIPTRRPFWQRAARAVCAWLLRREASRIESEIRGYRGTRYSSAQHVISCASKASDLRARARQLENS